MSNSISRKNRQTKTMISLFREGGAWIVACDDHGQCVEFNAKSNAIPFMAYPANFCSKCAEIIYSNASKQLINVGGDQ
jgi:hypothetical protein